MTRRAALIIVVGAMVSLLFAAVATGGEVDFGDPAPGPRATPEVVIDDTPPPTFELPEVVPDDADDTSGRIPAAVLLWLAVTGGALLVLWALYALRTALARIPRLVWRREPRGDTSFEVLPDVAAAVVGEADLQRAELLAGEPRNAIVRCWLRLEHDVASAGLTRHHAQTSAEFTESVLAGYSVDGEAIRALARLYREARFSRHDLDEAARREALDALERLHHALLVASADQPVLEQASAEPIAGR